MSAVHVVVAPDSFGALLSAVEAAEAVRDGWRQEAPDDRLTLVPMSDGGRGFVAVLAAAGLGELVETTVRGPLGEPVAARWLSAGDTAYVEAAEACGLHLVVPSTETVRAGRTDGVGELVRAAAAVSSRVVVGLGGTATNDGGAGLWRILEHEPGRTGAVELVVATDVDNPLLGPNGASAVYGPQKGADRATVLDLDDALRDWAAQIEAATGLAGLRDRPGAGAGGGLGFALLALGARRTSGVELVADVVRLRDRMSGADLVVTGEGSLDGQSLRGKVVAGVAALAQEAGLPCLAVAGRVELGRREAAAAGLDETFSVTELLGSATAALAAGADGVRAAAASAARQWSSGRPAPYPGRE